MKQQHKISLHGNNCGNPTRNTPFVCLLPHYHQIKTFKVGIWMISPQTTGDAVNNHWMISGWTRRPVCLNRGHRNRDLRNDDETTLLEATPPFFSKDATNTNSFFKYGFGKKLRRIELCNVWANSHCFLQLKTDCFNKCKSSDENN